jgi:hypothetical protein
MFKIGSLDQLMQINEAAARYDQQLDLACKKYEKMCFDNGAPGNNLPCFDDSNNPREYRDYIKNFEWNGRKFNQKLPLMELCQAFMKTLQTNDLQIKKFVDDLNSKKIKLAALTKKEGNNLTLRDFTDDIYQSLSLNIQQFLEGKIKNGVASTTFCNMLVVVPKNKVQNINMEMTNLMKEYYDNIDKTEVKRIAENSKVRLYEIKESNNLFEFVEKSGLPPMPVGPVKPDEKADKSAKDLEKEMSKYNSDMIAHRKEMEEWDKKALVPVLKLLTEELDLKKAARMPHVIVPDAPVSLNITDKEGNQVFRIIVYKAQ